MSNLQLGVLISGRGSNLMALIQAIQTGQLDATIKVVISNKPDAKGVLLAQEAGIPTVTLPLVEFESSQAQEQAIVQTLHHHQVDWVVLAGYMRIIGPAFLNAFPNKIINIHPSLLPAFKGLHAQKQAFDYGVKLTGCTTHFVNQELDGGAIILQKAVPVLPNDTLNQLQARILEAEHQLLPETLQLIAQNRVQLHSNKVQINL